MLEGLTDALTGGPLKLRLIQPRDRGVVIEIPPITGATATPVLPLGYFALENKRGADANSVPNVKANLRGSQSVDLQTARGAVVTRVASGNHSVIGGGANNTASGWYSTVPGGYANTASGTGASAAGSSCTASGSFSCAIGEACQATAGAAVSLGSNCLSSANYSFAAGRYATASAQFAYALGVYSLANRQNQIGVGGFTASAQWQHSSIFVRRETSDATPTELSIDGAAPTGTTITSSNRVIIAANTALDCMIYITGERKNTEGADYASYVRRCIITRNNSNSTTISAVQTIGTDIETNAAWDVAVTADDTNEALVITVTGAAASTVRWFARIEANEITHA